MRQGAVSLLSVILAIAAISCGGGDGATNTPIASSTSIASATLPASLQATDGNYTGVLGDFGINQGDFFASKPCAGGLGEQQTYPTDYKRSELWSKVFTSQAQPDYCADDNRLIQIFQYVDDTILRRSYFYELPLVMNFNRLREPPRLIRVDGYEAIVGEETSGTVYLYVIEREPGPDQQGIFDFVLAPDADAATDAAESLIP
jgi:hypothetical protein